MIILIDGYNLLKQVFHKVKGKFSQQREQLIKQLVYYKQKKKNDIDQIIIVFDGGLFNHAERFVQDGVIVIFSGKKDSADDWIINYTEKNKQKSNKILVISSDKEIVSKCDRFGADSLNVLKFYDILQKVLLDDVEKDLKLSGERGNIRKYENIDFLDKNLDISEVDSKALDLLMEQSMFDYDSSKDDVFEDRHIKKGEAKKKSKKKKSKLRKIKKLY